MKLIKIGKIVNTKGLKGEVKIYPYTGYKERFEEIGYFHVENEKMIIEKVTYLKEMPIVRLSGVTTIEQAQKLRNKEIFIESDQLNPLDEDEYLITDLIGLEVRNNLEVIGVVEDVLTHTAQHIYVIKGKDGEHLIPAVSEFIKEVNIEEGYILVELIEGM